MVLLSISSFNKSSKEIFAAVYAEVSEKRAEAQKAIDEA